MDTQFLTNKEAVFTSPMFRKANEIDPSIVDENLEKLLSSYSLKLCREILFEAWGIVLSGIIRGDEGLARFALLPSIISTSPLCVSVLLENKPLFDLALTGKISYTGIVRIALQKGIWAR